MRAIEQRLRSILAEVENQWATAKAATISVDANLIVAFGLDSLDTVELIMAIEDEFGLAVPDEVGETFSTIRIANNWLEKQGCANHEVFGYPTEDEPQVYLPVEEPVTPPFVVVLFANQLTKTGFDTNLYEDAAEAHKFAEILKGRNIFAQVYELRPV